MTDPSSKQHVSRHRARRALLAVLTVGTSLALASMAAEILLRVLPIPGINYHNFFYDDWTGGRLYPNSQMLYRAPGGETIKRRVNSLGYLDRDHAIAKAPGVTRIGFFGDSYTEARQVKLDDTFVRRAEAELNEAGDAEFETLSFGISGFGTIQSYLESVRWADSLDLDWVIYVFCENDMADQMPQIKRSNEVPYPYLTTTSFDIDFSFRERRAYKSSLWHRAMQYVKSRSLLAGTVTSRIKLLRKHGVKVRVTEEDMHIGGETGATKGPQRPMSAPSTWPDSLVTYGRELEGRILSRWHDDLKAEGRRFAILYVPRSQHLGTPYAEQDTWGGWLMERCAAEGIAVIDPSPDLLETIEHGTPAFRDHFTPAGHRVVATAVTRYILQTEARTR